MRKSALLVTAALVGALIAAPLAVYASHRFVDVPDSHTFHNAIDWMDDNGGSMLLTNQDGAGILIGVLAQADGAPIGNGIVAGATFAAGESQTTGYTTALPVTAGDHIVSISACVVDLLGAPIAGDFSYNLHNAVVTFVPDGSVTSLAGVDQSGGGFTGG